MNLFNWLVWLFTYMLVFHSHSLLECKSFIKKKLRKRHIFYSRYSFGPILITVDISNKFNIEGLQYTYNQSIDCHTYTANPGFLINKVTKLDNVLWDSRDYDDVYSNKVFVGFNEFHERVFRVYFLLPEPPQFNPLDEDIILPESKDSLGNDVYLIGANIQIKRSTKLVNYKRDPFTGVEVYTAKEPYRFGLLMNGNNTAWRCKKGPYPDKVQILMDEKGKPYCRFGLPKPESQPDPKLVLLDVYNRESTDQVQYKYDANEEVHTFIPNTGFLIYEIRIKGKLMWVCKDGIYPEKVFMTLNKQGYLDLEFDFPKVPTQKPVDQIGIVIMAKGSRRPINKSKYTLTQPSSGQFKYEFKPNVQCTMVKCNGQILWIYGYFNCRDYPTSVLYTNESVIDIHFGCGFIKYLRFPNGNWSEGIPYDIRIPQNPLDRDSKTTS